jgi:hypothetical protein
LHGKFFTQEYLVLAVQQYWTVLGVKNTLSDMIGEQEELLQALVSYETQDVWPATYL